MASQNTVSLACQMRAASLVYLAFLVLSYLGRAEDQGIAKDEVLMLMQQIFGGNLSASERKAQIRLLDSTQIETIRNEVYSRLQNPLSWEGGQPSQSYIDELMLIGDDWARSVFARQFRLNPNDKFLQFRRYNDPKLMATVGDMLFLDDQITEEMRQEGLAGRQSWAAAALLETLANCPAFTADVINWARRLEAARNKETMKVMREWWKANEAALNANDFKAVQPGRSLPEENASEPAIVPALVANSASPNAVATSVTERSSAVESPSPSSGFLWSCAAAVIALLVFWKRRPS